MKKMLFVMLALAGAYFLAVPNAHAQASSGQASASPAKNQASIDQDVALLRQDLRSKKKQIVAANLKLTDAEATKFWPVYDQYTAEMTKLGDEKYAIIKEYADGFGKITDEQAISLIKRSLAFDEKIAQLRQKYVPLFEKVIPGTKVATFFQIDRRLTTLMDLQLASEIPLVQDQK